MRIEVSTPATATALADYLGRCECTVLFVNDRTLEVRLRGRPEDDLAARLEIDAYLKVWEAMHPEEDAVHVRQ